MSQTVSFAGVTKYFGEVKALDNINLEVQPGEFLSLLGPSGCGKTTLLRICAGLETPTKGRILLEGKDVTDVPAYKRPVNMVFQRWALFPHKTVAENVAFGLIVKKVPRTEIARQVRFMLELVKMAGYEDRYPKQLSGGQSQRVALARALVMHPKVLLMDEPLGSLDLKLRREMQIELINIHKRLGTTFVYVTHDQEEALTMSDRIVVMSHGVIVQDGTPTQIYQKPNSVFAAQFIGETILFKGRVEAQDEKYSRVAVGAFTLICPRKDDLQLNQEVFVSIRPERVRIAHAPGNGLDNHVEGHIVNTIFKGPAVYYQVEIPGGQLITVQQNLEQDTPLHMAGFPVYLSWTSENCIVLSQ
ncbi:MAG: polyamine-transporting ATPase [Chloroflexota bacterium]|nr:MAG: polyamine-transporting ATPase [Chloroflexota bacterium]